MHYVPIFLADTKITCSPSFHFKPFFCRQPAVFQPLLLYRTNVSKSSFCHLHKFEWCKTLSAATLCPILESSPVHMSTTMSPPRPEAYCFLNGLGRHQNYKGSPNVPIFSITWCPMMSVLQACTVSCSTFHGVKSRLIYRVRLLWFCFLKISADRSDSAAELPPLLSFSSVPARLFRKCRYHRVSS